MMTDNLRVDFPKCEVDISDFRSQEDNCPIDWTLNSDYVVIVQ